MRIKICGIDDPEIARIALKAGADLIGVMLTPTSRRFVPVDQARAIVKVIREENSIPVLVFRHESFDVIASMVDKLGNCVVQFQGEQHPQLKKIISAFNTMIAFSVKGFLHLSAEMKEIFTEQLDEKKNMLLIDSEQPGSGKTFCWQDMRPANFPWFLAGGLHSENVQQAINQLSPTGVDVSTGVENSQGKKDIQKIVAFIRAVRNRKKHNEQFYSS